MANVAKVSLLWRHKGALSIGNEPPDALSVTTFHVKSGDSDPVIDEAYREDIIFHTLAWWESDNGGFVEVKSAFPSQLELYEVECRTIEPAATGPTITTLLEPSPGTSATRTLYPPQCCFGIGLRTLEETRRGRGRMYLPAWDPNEPGVRAAGFLTSENRTDLGHIGAHLAYEMRQVTGPGFETPFVLAVYSRLDGVARAVTHFEIPDRVLTQRRRAIRPLHHTACSLTTGDPA